MRRDLPVLFTARMHQYTWLSKTQVSKYKIIISDSSLYTYWCVSLNGLLSPQPLLGPGCFRGSITWQRRAPLPSLVVVLISVQVILAAKYSRNHPFTRYSGLSQVHRAMSATCQLINTFFWVNWWINDLFAFLILTYAFSQERYLLLVQSNKYQISALVSSTFTMPFIKTNPDQAPPMWQKSFWSLKGPSRSLSELEMCLDFFPKAQIP